MKLIASEIAGQPGKYVTIVDAFPSVWHGSILDVGCRDRGILKHIRDYDVSYVGLDLTYPADVVSNIELGLPFSDRTFETVLALDILEHTENIHSNFTELCRVSESNLVISLPNLYELRLRTKYLLGRPISGKYGLPTTSVIDRHRWLFSLRDASEFCRHMAKENGYEVVIEGGIVGPKRKRWVGTWLANKHINLFSTTYVALIRRKATEHSYVSS